MKLELHKYDVQLPDNVYLALAITGSLAPDGQRHTGFVVRNFFDESLLFHLGRNNYYRQEQLTKSYSYLVVPSLEPETANSIISLLVQLLDKTKGNVPYSIAWDQDEYFDDTGALVKTDPVDGFTCATFVLEILKRQGLNLVDRSSWPLVDAEWQKSILPKLDLSIESLMAQLEVIGKYPRIRPEEALGAAHLYVGEKLTHQEVVPAALEVVSEMTRLRAPVVAN
jgi:hypothetical protein